MSFSRLKSRAALVRRDPAKRQTKASRASSALVCRLQLAQAGNSKPFGRCLSGKTILAGWWSIVDAGVFPPQKQQFGCCLRKSPVLAIWPPSISAAYPALFAKASDFAPAPAHAAHRHHQKAAEAL